jgi:predicted negative regulator of RcsB-dependent stress response
MKLILAIVVVVVFAVTVFADWKWRQWMAARKRERESADHPPNG